MHICISVGLNCIIEHYLQEPNACATDPNCNCALNTCFLKDQTVDIDNCWFLVPKKDLNESGTVTVTVYNQALLSQEFSVQVNIDKH